MFLYSSASIEIVPYGQNPFPSLSIHISTDTPFVSAVRRFVNKQVFSTVCLLFVLNSVKKLGYSFVGVPLFWISLIVILLMKTSTQISLKFTTFTILVVMFFGISANILFFRSWYTNSMTLLKKPNPAAGQIQKVLGRERGPMLDRFPLHSIEADKVLEHVVWKNLSEINDRYFLFLQKRDFLLLTDVTHAIESQKTIFWTAIYLLAIFAILAYFLSLLFVKTSLRRLNQLVTFAKTLHLDHLDEKILVEGPEDDEIKILAETLNKSLSQLHEQAFALKDFVAHASHELKTPLMAMSSELDVAIKSKDLSSLKKIKRYLKLMDGLIAQLLVITKLESNGELKMDNHQLRKVVELSLDMVKKKYADKHLQWDVDLKNPSVMCHLQSVEMIVQNLLDNAAKYSKDGGKIKVVLGEQKLVVKDEGTGIENKYLKHIWERFWQEDASRTDRKSFGLGLFLVKKLVDKHGWSIAVESEKNVGTIFSLSFGACLPVDGHSWRTKGG